MNIKKILILSAILIIVPAASWYILQLERPFTVSAPCNLVPLAEWSITNPQPEVFMTKFTSHNPPYVENVRLFQFERPDFVTLSFEPSVRPGTRIQENEIIGSLQSTENSIRFEKLQGELQVTRANLTVVISGAKESEIQEAGQALQYARAEAEAYEPVLKRNRNLFKRELISEQDLDLTEAQYRLLKLNETIAEAQLKTMQTGAKKEETEVIRTQIDDIETRLNTIRNKRAAMVIQAPLGGTVIGRTTEFSIYTIANLDTLVARIPVEEQKIKYIRKGLPVYVTIPASSGGNAVSVVGTVDKNPLFVLGQTKTMFIVRANIGNPDGLLNSGMTGAASIHCDTLRLADHLRRWWAESTGRSIY